MTQPYSTKRIQKKNRSQQQFLYGSIWYYKIAHAAKRNLMENEAKVLFSCNEK